MQYVAKYQTSQPDTQCLSTNTVVHENRDKKANSRK